MLSVHEEHYIVDNLYYTVQCKHCMSHGKSIYSILIILIVPHAVHWKSNAQCIRLRITVHCVIFAYCIVSIFIALCVFIRHFPFFASSFLIAFSFLISSSLMMVTVLLPHCFSVPTKQEKLRSAIELCV